MYRKTVSFIILMLTLIITQTACNSEIEPVSKENYFMDTTCNISVYGTGDGLDEDIANQAIDAAYSLCSELDNTLSKTYEKSDTSRINNAGGEWVSVSDYTVDLLKTALEYCELSDGVFDVTIGGVTSMWDFHQTDAISMPDEELLAEAASHVDYKCVQIDGNRVRLTDPESQLDLGGIAKGYIGDRMTECLMENGVTSAIINLGGNIICVGAKPISSKNQETEPFTIGIETPYSDRTEISGCLELADETTVTSGVYERYFECNDKKYHHILSTENGYPVDSDVIAVTLTAEIGHSVDIDALSTICLIKGSEEGSKLIESLDGIEATFTLADGSRVSTSGMNVLDPQ